MFLELNGMDGNAVMINVNNITHIFPISLSCCYIHIKGYEGAGVEVAQGYRVIRDMLIDAEQFII